MKNNFFIKSKSKIKLNIKGKNIERFIKRLISNKIEILKVNYIKYNEVNIIIYKKDYNKLIELKTIYEVNLLDIYGIIKVRKVINAYKYLITCVVIGIFTIIFMSNIIFNVQIVHTDSEVRKFLETELELYDIKKYKFKKSFNEIQEIKNQITEKYKDKIEWLEIEEVGTTYIVRLEQRIIPDNEVNNQKQNIVAKKSAILKKIIAKNGQVIKEVNSYVNKGDIVISGNIYLNNEIKDIVRAEGVIYGEVWYNVSVEYPYIYSEIKETNNYKDVYVLKILNKNIEFTLNKFKEKRYDEKVILNHTLLPFSLVKQKQKEIETISLVLTEEEATDKAIIEAKSKMNDKLKENEYIIDYQILKTTIKEDKIVLDMFFTVCEDITDYVAIEEGEENVS